MFISKVFSFMEQILDLFDSRRISKRVCTTAVIFAERSSIDSVAIVQAAFFAALMDRFNRAMDYLTRMFPPQFFSLLLRVTKGMDVSAGVELCHSVSLHSYWCIVLSGTPDAAEACLEFICFSCGLHADDSREFANAASVIH
jgi:hypothetical protein